MDSRRSISELPKYSDREKRIRVGLGFHFRSMISRARDKEPGEP